jgi:hypothetical protein
MRILIRRWTGVVKEFEHVFNWLAINASVLTQKLVVLICCSDKRHVEEVAASNPLIFRTDR